MCSSIHPFHSSHPSPSPAPITPIIITPPHPPHTKQGDRSPPVLVVDGYNFLYQWRQLCHSDQQEDTPIREETTMEDAREAVVRALEVYSQYRGVRVVVVFDAMSNPLGSSR